MKKKKRVILIKDFKNQTKAKYPYAIIGVFKNEKQAQRYLTWLEKDKTLYRVIHTNEYEYVEGEKNEDK